MLKINNVYNMDCMEGIKLLDDKKYRFSDNRSAI